MRGLNSVIIEGVIVEKGEDFVILSHTANNYIYSFNVKFKKNISATFGRLRNGQLIRVIGSLERSNCEVVIDANHIEIVSSEAESSTISNE